MTRPESYSHGKPPHLLVVLAVLAVIAISGVADKSTNFSIVLGLIAIGFAMALRVGLAMRAGQIEFHDEELRETASGDTHPFANMESLSARASSGSGKRLLGLTAWFPDGGIMFRGKHKTLNAIREYLLERLPPAAASRTSPRLSAKAQAFFEAQLGLFESGRVYAIDGRSSGRLLNKSVPGLWGSLFLILMAIATGFLSAYWNRFSPGYDSTSASKASAVMFGISGVVGVIFSFAFSRANNLAEKVREGACMVIAPGGMALKQGDLDGTLRWEEILSMTSMHGRHHFRMEVGHSQRMPGIIVKIEGASIFIHDVFREPIAHIEQRLRNYWRPS